MLNVTMHWYAFQTLTMRSACSLGVSTCSAPSSPAQCSRRRSNDASTSRRLRSITGRTSALFTTARRLELRVARVLEVAEREDDLARLARRQVELHVVRAARRPPVGDGVLRAPALDHDRRVPPATRPEEDVTLGVEPRERLRAGEVREVVAALAVLGLVVDDAAVDLDLADREVALEVRGVVERVPEAELDRAEQRQPCALLARVRHPRAPDLDRLAQRHEEQRLRRRSPSAASRSACSRARGGTRSPRARARAATSRRCLNRVGTGSGRRRRTARCCSGSASPAAAGRPGRTRSRRRRWRSARRTPRCRGS